MKVLIAPLNWGLGHASRCVPIIRKYIANGDEVVLGGDGDSLIMLRQHFPSLRVVELASLNLRYSEGTSQIWAMIKAMPALIRFAILDHQYLNNLITRESFDLVVSDNRFGLFTRDTRCVYITHQLHICLPHSIRWLEPLCSSLHSCFYRQYDEVWVPDTKENGLSGRLGHPKRILTKVRYTGPLSRFSEPMEMPKETVVQYDVVAVLSGLEPQRTLFENEIIERYQSTNDRVLIVRGKVNDSNTCIQHGNITLMPYADDQHLAFYLLSARRIIARSGYSSIMDLAALNLLDKAELHPTPGQPEQEYLYQYLNHHLSSKLR